MAATAAKIPIDIRLAKGDGDQLTVSMSGEPEAVVHTLVNGLPLDALEQLSEAMGAELANRREK